MPRGVYPRKPRRRKRKAGAGTAGPGRRMAMHGAVATLEERQNGVVRPRRVKRQPHDFHFEVTEYGLRVQVGNYLVQISELIGSGYDSAEED